MLRRYNFDFSSLVRVTRHGFYSDDDQKYIQNIRHPIVLDSNKVTDVHAFANAKTLPLLFQISGGGGGVNKYRVPGIESGTRKVYALNVTQSIYT